ncbi:MAG TPA: hypothetical protein VN605_12785 [Thermoanaerobaculia bacterium]|nr:hypothetical protein [Thermoanaerobaculia bacterium]
MKKILIAFALFAAVACKVEKTGEDTYKVQTPDIVKPNAKPAVDATKTNLDTAGREVSKELKDLGTSIKKGAQDAANSEAARQAKEQTKQAAHAAGQALKAGAGKAAVAAGDALKSAGEKAQAEARESSATSTTSTRH